MPDSPGALCAFVVPLWFKLTYEMISNEVLTLQ